MNKEFIYGILIVIVIIQTIDANKKPKMKRKGSTRTGNNPENYCRQDLCDESEQHIGCFSNVTTFSAACGDHNTLHAVNGVLRSDILVQLNTFRNYVASGVDQYLKPAAHMPILKWDNDLAYLAKLTLLQCQPDVTFCYNLGKFRYVASSEVAFNTTTSTFRAKTVVEDMMPIWFIDIKGCSMDENNRIIPKDNRLGSCLGHYIPIIQDHASHVGCAVKTQKFGQIDLGRRTGSDTQSSQTTMSIRLHCNFSRGNVNELLTYTPSDKPGSECKTGLSRRYEFLCSADEKVNSNLLRSQLMKD